MINRLKIKSVSALALIALCAVSTGTAQANEPAPAGQEELVVSETVVIRGRSPAETRRYVDQVIAPPRGTEQFARWDDRLCIGVTGIPNKQAQYVADRIANRAMEVGLRPGKPGCKSDVSVIVTTEPEKLIEAMRASYEPVFGVSNEARTASLGQSAFEEFKTTDRPVRWWHVAQTVGADGSRIEGEAKSGIDGITGAPTVRAEGSRLRGAIRQDLSRAVVVIDAAQVAGLSLDTLSDYVAFVTLAQADPKGDTQGVETILNLFADGADEKPETWTSWDADFLTALYSVPRNTVSLQQTKSMIAQRMERE